jgi:pyruvate dehydrogenase E2 component (dihydrolipoamide acetyltransferase)
MVLIRAFEDKVHELFAQGRIPGFVHLYAGEEAVAVGVISNLEKGDYITSTHGGHGHCIAMGVDIKGMMAELFGRKTGRVRVREVIQLTSLRMTIAERMTESLRTMAQVTICREEVVDNVVKIREELLPLIEKEVGIRLTYTPILIKLVAEVLKEFPIINSTLEDNMIKVIDEINIGFAVAVDHGLIVPVVKEADKKSLKEAVIICNELTRKTRERRLSIEDVSGTFTIINLGIYGIDAFTPIINPPQIAILGVGRFVQKPVVQEGRVNITTVCTFSLTFDHRVVDGHTAAQFLDKLVSLIKDESRLRAVLSVK